MCLDSSQSRYQISSPFNWFTMKKSRPITLIIGKSNFIISIVTKLDMFRPSG